MAEFPALPLWTDAYLADTTHLTDAEHGIYLKLMIHAWRTPECRLPADPKWIARKVGKTVDEFEESVMPLLEEFWHSDGNYWRQKRLTSEHNFLKKRSKKQSGRAKSRWDNNKEVSRSDAGDMPNECQTDAGSMPDECRTDAPTPTPTPPSVSNETGIHAIPDYENEEETKAACYKLAAKIGWRSAPTELNKAGLDWPKIHAKLVETLTTGEGRSYLGGVLKRLKANDEHPNIKNGVYTGRGVDPRFRKERKMDFPPA